MNLRDKQFKKCIFLTKLKIEHTIRTLQQTLHKAVEAVTTLYYFITTLNTRPTILAYAP